MKPWHKGLAKLAASLLIGASSMSIAQTLDKKEFNVVGTWSFLTNWQALEQPLWTKELPAASNGAIKGNIKSITEVNLKGTELLRLLKQGVFDVAAALPIYIEDGGAVIEAVDIAGVAKDFKMSRDIVNAWMPEMQTIMRQRHNAMILGRFPCPEQVFWCRGDIRSVADLKGKKVRVQGTSQGDFVTGVGGSAVTIPFGEVVPALEKGVVDCGITGTMAGHKAKWPEVTNTMFRLPVGYTIGIWVVNLNTWNKLSKDTQAFLQKQMQSHENKAWQMIEAETEEGVNCATGQGACSPGNPGKVKLVKPSASDLAAREKVLNEVVLARWAKRCGDACSAKWNDLVGKKYNLSAVAK
ncbi:MAG: TRAP transporter substrate-binding protein [Burkholderiales bacterium]